MIALIVSLMPALFAALPLFGRRFIPTHDGEYHIIRFWQFFNGLASGNAFPRWAPQLNSGLGIPLFTFQYPFPNYVGSFFHVLGFSFVDSVKWTLALGYITAAIGCYLWLRASHSKAASVAGTIVASFVPYWFVDIYVRGSVGEVWGIAFVFLGLAAISRSHSLFVACAVTLLIISHNIIALIFVPVLAVYALLKQPGMFWYVILGALGAAFFWVPATYEQRFITGLSPVNIFDHFPSLYQLLIPSWGSGFRGSVGGGNEMSYQIGIVPLSVFALSLATIVRKRRHMTLDLVFAVVCFSGSVFFMLPVSHVIWQFVPIAHFIQYPWRLLSLVIVSVPLMAALLTERSRFLGWALVILSCIAALGYVRPASYESRDDAHYLTRESFTAGTSSLGNAFQTVWLRAPESAPGEFRVPGGTVRADTVGPTRYRLYVSASSAATLIAPLAYYPGWQARMGSERLNTGPSQGGLLAVGISSGKSTVEISLGRTTWQVVSELVSILSLSVACLSFILRRRL